MDKISIILPTYNEAGNIVKLIKDISNQTGLKNYQLEFIVVDDNSPDGTANQVKNLADNRVKLFVRKKERGLATAILLGIKKSSGQVIVLMDTDFNHQPKDIVHLITPLKLNQADLVIGSRYVKGGGMHISEAGTIQFLGSKFGNLLVNKIILRSSLKESLSGFLAFKKKILKGFNLTQIFQGYGDYCIRLLYFANKERFKLAEIPVVYGKRQYGISKSNLIKMFFNYFKTALSLRFIS